MCWLKIILHSFTNVSIVEMTRNSFCGCNGAKLVMTLCCCWCMCISFILNRVWWMEKLSMSSSHTFCFCYAYSPMFKWFTAFNTNQKHFFLVAKIYIWHLSSIDPKGYGILSKERVSPLSPWRWILFVFPYPLHQIFQEKAMIVGQSKCKGTFYNAPCQVWYFMHLIIKWCKVWWKNIIARFMIDLLGLKFWMSYSCLCCKMQYTHFM